MNPILDIGTEVKPYGKVAAVGTTMGERYYWFVDEQGAVAMMPAIAVEPAHQKHITF